jgi:CRISPR-associated exonuclease Cas4
MVPDPRIACFIAVVEAHDLHGLAFQHLALCERRAWLHLSRIDYAHLDAGMAHGTAAHEVSRPRDRSVEGLFGLAPDRIDWEGGVVVEAKNGSGAGEAVSRQTAFYALMLAGATGRSWRARNDLLAARRRRDVPVDDAMIDALLADAHRLAELSVRETAPAAEAKPICASCSYRHLCGVA